LVEKQRADIHFINADEPVVPALRASLSDQQKLYTCIAHDLQDGLPLLVENSVLWRLECKTFLHEAEGLQTPKGELLAIDTGKADAKDDVMRPGGEPVSFEEFQQ